MTKNKKQHKPIDSILNTPKNCGGQQMGRNNIRKNNMNYTNINKNRGK